jgi:hypothetical protein
MLRTQPCFRQLNVTKANAAAAVAAVGVGGVSTGESMHDSLSFDDEDFSDAASAVRISFSIFDIRFVRLCLTTTHDGQTERFVASDGRVVDPVRTHSVLTSICVCKIKILCAIV